MNIVAMSETRAGRTRKTEKRVRLTAILILLLLFFMSGGGYVYAKYYSRSVKNGIAIASGVYFTANYAVESDSEEDFFESIVKTGYQGTDTDFIFEVRNYENNMLFNESTVVIPYSISFWLGGTPESAVYTVEYDGESKEINAGETGKATFSMHSIEGGRAAANKYTIRVDVEDGAKHTAVPVYAEVRTEAGAIINSVLRGKMILSTATQSGSYIESQMFVVSGDVTTDEEKFTEIQKLSEFTYEIRTVGELAGNEVTEELKLSWDPTVLEINLFDDAFQAWRSAEGKDIPDVDTNGWYYITVRVMPYSAETVGFFRGNEFAVKAVDWSTLHNYIKAEKYLESSEETE